MNSNNNQNNDSSSEDDLQVYETLTKLAPPNELLPRKLTIDIDVKSLYPLKPLPQFCKTYTTFFEESLQRECSIPDIQVTDENRTLLDYYEENKQNLVYKRFDQLDLGKRTSNDRTYFASLIANFKRTQPRVFFRGEALFDQKLTPCPSDQIQFDSNFESGNLFCAFKKAQNVYDLIIQNDINTRGNTQWFFFSVTGAKAGQTIQFNILNHLKTGSLFNEGLQPAVYSVKENQLIGTEWCRDGFNISYFKSVFMKEYPLSLKKKYYQLRFHYTFKHEGDKVYFAHSYPYTYTNLLEFLNTQLEDQERNQYLSRKVLCTTLGGNTCEVLTITSNSLQKRAFRKGVVFLARQHPGEPQASYVMQGIIDFLTSNNPQADYLRQNCIFKIFPMMNTDGVVNGNYRCGLEGGDLNRRWKKPNKYLHPSVYYAKKYVKGFSKERQILLVVDLHGHSRKQSSFVYGCAYSSQVKTIERVFALLMSKVNPFMDYSSCTFRVESAKDKTARIQIWRELKINWVYTYECSFYGQQKKHYQIKDYLNCGVSICNALSQIVKDTTKEFTNQSNQPDIQQQMLEELGKMPQTDDQDIGSDSSQSEAELSDDELVQLFQPKTYSIKQKKPFKIIGNKQQKKTIITEQQFKINNSFTKSIDLVGVPLQKFRIKTAYEQPKAEESFISNPSSIEKTPLMVDKSVQTDDWMYRQWLIQMGKLKKQQEFQSFTPTRNIYKSSSQSVTRFVVKNSTMKNDRGRVDSISLMASGLQNKLSKMQLTNKFLPVNSAK
ncbi:unnamed protein product (macronuclear) [Paramecium tetraurelia]|uniref:Peptidase M14 domain-containing protein n=1 Tax=Paramecium tetraurelia TaxID=5888 RepID=A0DLD3_PARTE|nr:uncharacterized protein GSPATT00018167001 [Paramecium tetraurelia]CAK83850.1 unnamed protein product [Paramecium tetraurelia]|eukprot:XP_001451247.1 hypothetical protein (macronuclear) [Paramecium tetraurelia strain d4-2]